MDTTPEGAIRHTAAATAINVNEEYDFPLALPLGEGGGLFGNNLPRARASLTFEDLSEIRRLQREQYGMFTEDTRSQQRVADARGVIREQNRNLRGGTLFGGPASSTDIPVGDTMDGRCGMRKNHLHLSEREGEMLTVVLMKWK